MRVRFGRVKRTRHAPLLSETDSFVLFHGHVGVIFEAEESNDTKQPCVWRHAPVKTCQIKKKFLPQHPESRGRVNFGNRAEIA